MGAGISKKQDRDLKRSRLISICRELVKAGVPAVYDSMRVHGPGFDVRFRTTVRCSNGEAFGNLSVTVLIPLMPKEDWKYEVECGDTQLGFEEWKQHMLESHADTIEQYRFLEATDYGLQRLKALYGNAEHQAKRTETELSWLITKIERKAKQDRPVFLLTPEGKLFDSGEQRNKYARNPSSGLFPGAMYEGQLYCYSEMQDGKPMVRVRQGVGPENYTEFLPDWSVVDKAGNVVAKRNV